MNNPTLKKLDRQITPAIAVASSLSAKINNPADLTTAVEVLSNLNKYHDAVTDEKEKITKPLNVALNVALKAARTLFAPLEKKLDEAIASLRDGMSKYQTTLMNKKRDEEARIARDLESGKIKKIETAVRKMQEVDTVPDAVETESGVVKFRETQILNITDLALIPREYLVPDERALTAALKAGTTVPGAILETKQVPINYRA